MINQTYETYFKYLYRTEDTLYQLVFDRVHRPHDYQARMSGRPASDSFELSAQQSKDFMEMRYVEQVSGNRLGLLTKVPLAVGVALTALFSRRLVTAHGRLVTHLQYVHVGDRRRVVYNGLGFVRLLVLTLNLATAVAGSLLCGYQY